MVLLLDNYDSFTYNLVQYLQVLGAAVEVVYNDQISLAQIEAMAPRRIVISPGPGRPEQAGLALDLVEAFAGRVPILGVCLGMQVVAQVFGADVVRAPEPVHGKTSEIHHDSRTLFAGVENPFAAMRYHSLVVARAGFPAALEISAETADGLPMAIRHKSQAIEGVQFHPESILSEHGMLLLENFLKL
jgi:para-aminobenzoate synthetase component II